MKPKVYVHATYNYNYLTWLPDFIESMNVQTFTNWDLCLRRLKTNWWFAGLYNKWERPQAKLNFNLGEIKEAARIDFLENTNCTHFFKCDIDCNFKSHPTLLQDLLNHQKDSITVATTPFNIASEDLSFKFLGDDFPSKNDFETPVIFEGKPYQYVSQQLHLFTRETLEKIKFNVRHPDKSKTNLEDLQYMCDLDRMGIRTTICMHHVVRNLIFYDWDAIKRVNQDQRSGEVLPDEDPNWKQVSFE